MQTEPKTKNTTFRKRRKFEIKDSNVFFYTFSFLGHSCQKDKRAKAVNLVTERCPFCSHIRQSHTTLSLFTFTS